jgi:hypothetical protein
MTRAEIEDKVRSWLLAAGAAGGLAGGTVIMADQNGPRPAPPYLLVKTVVHDIRIGEDERLVNDDTPPQIRLRGQRYNTLSVQAFGEQAVQWLERATLRLYSPAILELTNVAGVAIQTEGGLTNLSGLRDQAIETRFVQDIRVDYERLTPVDELEDGVELATVEHEDTWKGGQPGDLVQNNTVTVG